MHESKRGASAAAGMVYLLFTSNLIFLLKRTREWGAKELLSLALSYVFSKDERFVRGFFLHVFSEDFAISFVVRHHPLSKGWLAALCVAGRLRALRRACRTFAHLPGRPLGQRCAGWLPLGRAFAGRGLMDLPETEKQWPPPIKMKFTPVNINKDWLIGIGYQDGCQLRSLKCGMFIKSSFQAGLVDSGWIPKNEFQHFIIARALLKGYVKIGAWD